MDVRLVNSESDWTQFQLVGNISGDAVSGATKAPLSLFNFSEEELNQHILLDLNDATFLDSSGIGWLLSVNRVAKERGYSVVVHSVPPLIHRVFTMMRLGEVIPVVEGLDEARNHVTSTN
ncbi:MAG: STAS domain-containing protein [Planctomycetaceae bacterium]|nr:STAS domain-containing protein [Planctomycetaceae bacterium]